jgi:hypothetical protein
MKRLVAHGLRLVAVPSAVSGQLLALLFVACSHNPPPETAAAPEEPAPAPIATSLTPGAASGTYRINATMRSARSSGVRRSQGSILLSGTQTAAPLPGDAPATQFNATISLTGYTVAPRGRSGQAGAWWPIGGDSVVVEFLSANAGQIQLRGAVSGRTIQGEVWFLSGATGATFQMGTFTATKGR